MFGETRMKRPPPRVWHNPNPESLGTLAYERVSTRGRHKVLVIQTARGDYTIYGYRYDDSDLLEGRSNSVGWYHVSGPSITDSLDTGKCIADDTLALLEKEE